MERAPDCLKDCKPEAKPSASPTLWPTPPWRLSERWLAPSRRRPVITPPRSDCDFGHLPRDRFHPPPDSAVPCPADQLRRGVLNIWRLEPPSISSAIRSTARRCVRRRPGRRTQGGSGRRGPGRRGPRRCVLETRSLHGLAADLGVFTNAFTSTAVTRGAIADALAGLFCRSATLLGRGAAR